MSSPEEGMSDHTSAQMRGSLEAGSSRTTGPDIGAPEIRQMINDSIVANTVARGPKLKATEPDIFSGLAIENPEDWYNRLLDYFRLSLIDDDCVRVTTFRTLLRGIALLWYDDLDEDDRCSFEQLKAPFLSRFNDNSQKWLVQETLDSRTLKKGEPIDNYVNDMLRLAHKLKLSNTETCNAIKRGLYPELKMYIISSAPPDLEALLSKIQMGHTIRQLHSDDAILPLSALQNRASKELNPSVAGLSLNDSLQACCDKAICSIEHKIHSATEKATKKINNAAHEALERTSNYLQPVETPRYPDIEPNRYDDRYYPRQESSQPRRYDYNRNYRGSYNPNRPQQFSQNDRIGYPVEHSTANQYSDSRPVIECSYCHKRGHHAERCFSKARDQGRPITPRDGRATIEPTRGYYNNRGGNSNRGNNQGRYPSSSQNHLN